MAGNQQGPAILSPTTGEWRPARPLAGSGRDTPRFISIGGDPVPTADQLVVFQVAGENVQTIGCS